MIYRPHDYQRIAEEKIIELPAVGLFLDMGLGKTVITLTAINRLMYEMFAVARVLVIAPKRVAEDTWSRESQKWDHLKHLKLSKILGTREQRLQAVNSDADIYIINRENVAWLVEECQKKRRWPYDMVVIDELSSFKSSKSQRFRALKKVTPLIKRIVGLTGTPTPNGLLDLWPQMYLLDRGQRLGKTITGYRDRYFNPGMRNGYTVFNWTPKEGADRAIQEKIKDICISMSASDYLTLPERMSNIIPVELSEKEKKLYKTMEKEQILSLDESEIVALTAATVTNKLLQMANGTVYDMDRNCKHIHDRKLEALEEILDVTDEPVLVFYNFQHDYDRLVEHFRKLDPRRLDTADDIREWNEGKVRLLLAHPASVGHGLNIQDGGHIIIWFGLTWSLELYQQANARLYRQGQKKNVIIHHLVASGTIDEQVMAALEKKDTSQRALLDAVKSRRKIYEDT